MSQRRHSLRKFSLFALLCLSLLVVISPSAGAQSRLFSAEAKQKAQALLKQMTLDEKIGQLNQSSGRVIPVIAEENRTR
jgi:beta-glucosidase